jgi:hypothetical protein
LHGEIGFAVVSIDSGVFGVVFVEFFFWHHATCFLQYGYENGALYETAPRLCEGPGISRAPHMKITNHT